MAVRIKVPTEDTLTGKVAELSAEWRAIGSDSSFIRILSYRSDLVPAFFDFYLRMRGNGLLTAKVKELARLRIARLNTCKYWLGSLSALAKQQGITDQHIAELETRPPGLFTNQELAALDLAEALWNNAGQAGVNKELMERLHKEFTDGQLVELVWAIGQYIGLGKMVAFLGLERDV
jgi:AhpD family alkylhydroperoxidase